MIRKTMVLLLDFINDIVDPRSKIAGSAGFIEKHNVLEKANELIAFARKNSLLIAHVKVGFSEQYLECPKASPIFGRLPELQALKLNTWGTEFHPKINIKPEDAVIVKNRVSAFYATHLETILRVNSIQKLIIAGVSTDMAVQSTACDAHDRDYKVVVAADACGAGSEEFHQSALKLIQRIAVVSNVADLS